MARSPFQASRASLFPPILILMRSFSMSFPSLSSLRAHHPPTSTFRQASKVRSTGATHLNRSSSRSHAMVTILVSSKLPTAHSVNLKAATALRHKRLLGKINLIDLAGSENNKSANGKDAVRMAESAAINKSLSVLGQVINAINSSAVRINTIRGSNAHQQPRTGANSLPRL